MFLLLKWQSLCQKLHLSQDPEWVVDGTGSSDNTKADFENFCTQKIMSKLS